MDTNLQSSSENRHLPSRKYGQGTIDLWVGFINNTLTCTEYNIEYSKVLTLLNFNPFVPQLSTLICLCLRQQRKKIDARKAEKDGKRESYLSECGG